MSLMGSLESVSLDLAKTHDHISSLIRAGNPFLVGRPGGTESEGLYFFVNKRLASRRRHRPPYSAWFKKFSQIGPGITHFSDNDLDAFCREYLEACLSSDLLGFGRYAPGALGVTKTVAETGSPVTHYSCLEPFEALSKEVESWTKTLEGLRVLVIHPFDASIRKQFARKNDISGVVDLLPDFDLDVVVPPVTFAGVKSDRPWSMHFQDLKDNVLQREFDVAIIGAGSYGLPIGRAIKESGRGAIHLGGTTQILFGIRGKRWETRQPFTDFIDHTWIRPSADEKPPGAEKVEGGIYW